MITYYKLLAPLAENDDSVFAAGQLALSLKVPGDDEREISLGQKHALHNLLGLLDYLPGLPDDITISLRKLLEVAAKKPRLTNTEYERLFFLLNSAHDAFTTGDYPENIVSECHNYVVMINDPMQFSHIGTIDINREIQAIVDLYSALHPEVTVATHSDQDLSVQLDAENDTYTVTFLETNPDLLRNSLRNLLSNAFQFAKMNAENKAVEVDVVVKDGILTVKVFDTGPAGSACSTADEGPIVKRQSSGFALRSLQTSLSKQYGNNAYIGALREEERKTYGLMMPVVPRQETEYANIVAGDAPIVLVIDDGQIQRMMYKKLVIDRLTQEFPDLNYAILSDTGRADEIIAGYGERVELIFADNQMTISGSPEGRDYVHSKKPELSPRCERRVTSSSPKRSGDLHKGRRLSVPEIGPDLTAVTETCRQHLCEIYQLKG